MAKVKDTSGPDGPAALGRLRLDQAMAARGLTTSRARARDDILRGFVRVNDQVVLSPAQLVSDKDQILSAAPQWVSRGAEKLVAALAAFAVDPAGRIAMDVGASTGGFTDVLLSRGAAKVYAIDVGQGQLHPRIRADARVVALEKIDARAISGVVVPEFVSLIVIDVSFIGLGKVLPVVVERATAGADLIALVKPQFEVGPEFVGKGGIVRDPRQRARALREVEVTLSQLVGWQIMGRCPSPITGSDGNEEFLIWARKS